MLTFLHPYVFGVAPLPLVIRWLLPPKVQPEIAVRVPFINRLRDSGASGETKSASTALSSTLQVAVWLALLTALARPQWLEKPIERKVPTRDLLLVVDLSGSMEEEDFTSASGEPISRLAAAKEVLGDFVLKRKGDRLGLVVFGNAPYLQVPFTTDLNLCKQLLDEAAVGMAGPRTALGDAIGLGIKLMEESDSPQKTIVAITDGNDTASAVPPIEASRIARDNEITIHTVAIGDPTTVGEEELDQQALKNVSSTTGGGFYLALNREELNGIYDKLDGIETTEIKAVSFQPKRDLYYWPLACALLISVANQLLKLRSSNRTKPQAPASWRLRVNPHTFELEGNE